jgi:hypothetical protein
MGLQLNGCCFLGKFDDKKYFERYLKRSINYVEYAGPIIEKGTITFEDALTKSKSYLGSQDKMLRVFHLEKGVIIITSMNRLFKTLAMAGDVFYFDISEFDNLHKFGLWNKDGIVRKYDHIEWENDKIIKEAEGKPLDFESQKTKSQQDITGDIYAGIEKYSGTSLWKIPNDLVGDTYLLESRGKFW